MPLPLATILLDPPTTFFAGALIALLGTRVIRKRGAVEVWRAAILAVVWSVIYGLGVGWMYFIRTDWMFVYLMDTSALPLAPTYLAFFVIMLAFGLAGAVAVGHLVQNGRFPWAVGLTGLGAFTLVMVALLTASQYVVVGTTAEYWAGTAKKLADDAEALRGMNGITVATVLGSLPILWLRIKDLRAP